VSTDHDRPARGLLADRLREIEHLVEDSMAQIAEVARPDERDVRLETERAEAARTGALGRDWQRIQSRLDAGDVTLADVFVGGDDSPEATALRAGSAATLRSARDEAEHEPDGPSAELFARIAAARAGLGGPPVGGAW
jgi:hypothetical protein